MQIDLKQISVRPVFESEEPRYRELYGSPERVVVNYLNQFKEKSESLFNNCSARIESFQPSTSQDVHCDGGWLSSKTELK